MVKQIIFCSIFLMITSLILGCDDEGNSSSSSSMEMNQMENMNMVGTMTLPSSDLNLSTQEIRSCDLVFSSATAKIQSVSFNNSVIGVFQSRPPKSAVSFVLKEDEGLLGGIASIDFSSGSLSDLQLMKTRCFNRLGTLIEGENIVSLNDGDSR